MNKILHKAAVAVISLLVLAFSVCPILTLAANTGATSSIGFYVKAQIPENQIDTSLTYFDLLMKPGQTQVLAVDVVNESNEVLSVKVEAISASTSRTGIIDYTTPNVKDKTLKTPFSEIATPATPELSVPAGGSAIAQVTVTMPAASYDGVVLGGIAITKIPKEIPNAVSEGGSVAMGVQNVYSYVLGVKLSETETVVSPEFEMDSAVAESVDYHSVVTHYLRNGAAAIVKGMELNVDVYKKDTNELVAHVEKSDVDMAPNSVLPLAVSMDSGGDWAPGDYRSVITIKANGKTQELETFFSIDRTEVASITQRNIPNSNVASAGAFQLWVFIFIIAILLLLILILLLLLLFKRRKKEDEEQQEQRNTRN